MTPLTPLAPLTWLYAPADRPDRVAKALAGDADVVIVDLEDAVAPAAKDQARAGLAALATDRPLQVRVNAADTPWHQADLAAVADLPGHVEVRLPKCEDPGVIAALAERLGRPLHLLVESALGVERAYALATAHPGVASITLGEADLRADLGVTSDDGLLWARSRVVVAAAAAALPPPSMSAWTHVHDLAGLADSCRAGRALGFLGRTAIHPAQLGTIKEAFTPSAGEVERAAELVAAAQAALAAGSGAVALPDGRFVDEAVLRQARRTLQRAGQAR